MEKNKYLWQMMWDVEEGLISTNAPKSVVQKLWKEITDENNQDEMNCIDQLAEQLDVLYPGTERLFIDDEISA